MQVINARNVNDAILMGVDMLAQHGYERESRNGPVLVMDGPVTTVYKAPEERVLLWAARDANPFFHLYEALYMLTGSCSVAPLRWFVKNMERFSDDGYSFNGFYGHRWRNYFGKNQLDIIVKRLIETPDDRRSVLQMWDGREDLGSASADVPCNTAAYLSINVHGELDITVTNRSNDIVWGAYGANVVHMSMLQSYLAHRIGVDVGIYRQVSNNFHGYLDTLVPLFAASRWDICPTNPYSQLHPEALVPEPLFQPGEYAHDFEFDLATLASTHPKLLIKNPFRTRFFCGTVYRAVSAYQAYKRKDYEGALSWAFDIEAKDWRVACSQWLERRMT